MKKLLLIGLVLGALLIVAVLVVPPFIDLGAHKARFLPLVEEALRRKVDLGEVRLRIIPEPSIRISALAVGDNPAFSKEAFFSAQQLRLRLKFWPLLTGQFQVDEFVLEKPVVNLIKRADGTFNFADLGKKRDPAKKEAGSEKGKAREPTRLSELIPAKIRVDDAAATVQTLGQKPLKIGGIEISLEDFSAERRFPYRFAFKLPGTKPISLEGFLSYDESAASLSLKDNRLKAQDVDFAVNGALSSLSAIPQVSLTLANEGFETKAIVQLLSAAGVLPKELDISGPMGLKAALNGPSHSLASALNAQLKGLKVNDQRAFNGTVDGGLSLTIPMGGDLPLAQTLRGNGKLAAKDGALTNVDLISKIQALTGLIGLPKEQASGATTFKTLETEFTVGGGVANIQRLFLISPLMEASGGGRILLSSQALDIGIEVALAAEMSGRLGGGNAATFFKDSQGRIIIPLKITGPVNSPSVSLDTSKVVRKGVGELFERFFKAR